MRTRSVVAVVLALHLGRTWAQDEPPATWDPRSPKVAPPVAAEPAPSGGEEKPTGTPISTGTSTAISTATATATPTPTATATATATGGPLAPESPERQLHLPGPTAGRYRWNVMFGAGPAAAGAPGYLAGVGMALGAVRGARIELNAHLGWSSATRDVPVQASWNQGSQTYSSATTSARAFLFELTASRRAGAFELWAGGGIHVSTPQFEATYEETRCFDFPFCLNRGRVTDTDARIGSGAVGPLLSAGARLPLFEHVLLGVDLRWLAPATSRVEDRYGISIVTGGLAASAGVVLRLGAPVPQPH